MTIKSSGQKSVCHISSVSKNKLFLLVPTVIKSFRKLMQKPITGGSVLSIFSGQNSAVKGA